MKGGAATTGTVPPLAPGTPARESHLATAAHSTHFPCTTAAPVVGYLSTDSRTSSDETTRKTSSIPHKCLLQPWPQPRSCVACAEIFRSQRVKHAFFICTHGFEFWLAGVTPTSRLASLLNPLRSFSTPRPFLRQLILRPVTRPPPRPPLFRQQPRPPVSVSSFASAPSIALAEASKRVEHMLLSALAKLSTSQTDRCCGRSFAQRRKRR